MQHWKSSHYRSSRAHRGEVEKASFERILFFRVQAAFLAIMLNVFYWSIWSPIAERWESMFQILTKAGL